VSLVEQRYSYKIKTEAQTRVKMKRFSDILHIFLQIFGLKVNIWGFHKKSITGVANSNWSLGRIGITKISTFWAAF
jgi:hypothetical protein